MAINLSGKNQLSPFFKNNRFIEVYLSEFFISAIAGMISAILPPYYNFKKKMTDFLKKKDN